MRSAKYNMWKVYDVHEDKKMHEETYELSRIAARMEVFQGSLGKIIVKVRCRTYSKVYWLCRHFRFDWR